jgi:hypothetical protein
MLRLVGVRASQRKMRLFAVACCRRLWGRLSDERSRRAVEVAERFADGEATTPERSAARQSAREVITRYSGAAAWYPAAAAAYAAEYRGWHAAWYAAEAAGNHAGQKARPAEVKVQADLLRCVVGNPFRPASVSPAWRTPQVVALARAAYDQREMPAGTLDLPRLAVLADALEEAGCDQPDVLDHIRGPGPHVRGCWVLDLLLGRG